MEKPDIWMPYYGQDFERDTKGWSRQLRWSYWTALWAYWCAGCVGLPNNDDLLRRVCECEPSEWVQAKELIFCGKPRFFLQSGGWHQKRACELYTEAAKNVQIATERAKKAAGARWENDLPADAQASAQALLEYKHEQCLADATSTSSVPVTKTTTVEGGLRPSLRCDSDWVSVLEKSEAYSTINVRQELSKMTIWCQANGRHPTRKRFLRWLNRIEKPMTVQGDKQKPTVWQLTQKKEALTELVATLKSKASEDSHGIRFDKPEDRMAYFNAKKELTSVTEQIAKS